LPKGKKEKKKGEPSPEKENSAPSGAIKGEEGEPREVLGSSVTGGEWGGTDIKGGGRPCSTAGRRRKKKRNDAALGGAPIRSSSYKRGKIDAENALLAKGNQVLQ